MAHNRGGIGLCYRAVKLTLQLCICTLVSACVIVFTTAFTQFLLNFKSLSSLCNLFFMWTYVC